MEALWQQLLLQFIIQRFSNKMRVCNMENFRFLFYNILDKIKFDKF